MFEGGLYRHDLAISLRERGSDLRAAIGGDAGNQALHQRPVLGLADRNRPLERVVENENAHQIDGPQVLHHPDRSEARQFHLLAFHRRRLVHDQDHACSLGRARRREFGGQQTVQRILDGFVLGIDITLAADHQHAAALLHERLEVRLERRGQRFQIPVVQHHGLIAVQRLHRRGAGLFHVVLRSLQYAQQMRAGARWILGKVKQPGPPQGERLRKSQLAQALGRDTPLHLHRAAGGETGVKPHAALARRQFHFLHAQRLALGSELDLRLGRPRRAHHEVDRKPLAGERRARRGDGFEPQQRLGAAAQRIRVNRDSLLLRLPRRPHGAAAIFLAIGNQHHARHHARRNRSRRVANSRLEVRALAALAAGAPELEALRGLLRGKVARLARKGHHPQPVPAAGGFERAHDGRGLLQVRRRHAGRGIH